MRSITHSLLTLLCLLSIRSIGQQVDYVEYFFDTDPGKGNGTEISITPDSAVDINIAIATTDLTPGFHVVYFRAIDTAGNNSLMHKSLFFIEDATPHIPVNQLASLEYFIDSDPGVGSATPIPFVPDSSISIDEIIPLTGLSPGFHIAYFRAVDTGGSNSLMHKSLFFIEDATPHIPVNQLASLEYFIDSDPGVGSATPIPFVPDSSISIDEIIPLTGLSPGFHIAYFRAVDTGGSNSLMHKMLFLLEDTKSESLPKIVSIEYFLDVDTPLQTGYRQYVTADTLIDNNNAVPTIPMESGRRRLHARALDEDGNWGLLTPTDSITVVECEWVYNTQDTGLGSFRFAVNCANPGDTINFDSAVFDQTLLLQVPRIDIHKDLIFLSDESYNITLSEADINNTQLLMDIGGDVYMHGLNLIGKSAESFLFKISANGSFEIIEGK